MQLAKKFTAFLISNNIIAEEDRDIYEYSYLVLFMNIVNYSTLLLLAIITGRIAETFLFILGFIAVRKQAGGYHASTAFRCYLLTVLNYIIYLVALHCVKTLVSFNVVLILSITSCFIIWVSAPVADINKPFIRGEYKRYKRNSRIIISVFAIASIIVAGLGDAKYTAYLLSFCFGNIFAAVSLLIARLAYLIRVNSTSVKSKGGIGV